MRNSFKLIFVLGIIFIFSLSFFASTKYFSKEKGVTKKEFESGFVESAIAEKEEFKPDPNAEIPNLFNLLVLGIDRRSRSDDKFLTDVMMLLTINTETNKILFTSIPRDLWADSYKINAARIYRGIRGITNLVKKITGLKADKYIELDFQAFVDSIDALGGIDVNLERPLIDPYYPLDRPGVGESIHANFPTGNLHLNGEQALIYARSRKTTSDFDRMRRQQEIVKALPKAFFSPKNIFNPFVIESFYKAIKDNMDTNLSISEVYLLVDMLKDYKKYQAESIVIDTTNYLYHPPNEEYGGAYVLVPIGENYNLLHSDLLAKLSSEATPSATTETPQF